MISFSRPFFTPVAILMRQESGAFVVGFVPLLFTLLWFSGITLLLLFLRGFAEDTWIGARLDLPIAPPMAVLTLTIGLTWLVRSVGLWSPQGPLRDHDSLPGFTGRAGRFWSRISLTDREWTVLDTYEPVLFSATGAVLLVFPWTRVAGVMLILMAIACAYQTIWDRLSNPSQEESLEDYIAGVLSLDPDEETNSTARPHVPTSPYADLPDDLVELLDDDAKEQAKRDRGAAQPSAPSQRATPEKAKAQRSIELKPRGAAFHRPGSTLALLFYAALGLGLFLVVMDPSHFYEQSPDRCRAGILSVQTGAARIGLASPAGREHPGGLATTVLDRVAPDDLGKLRRDAIRREEGRIQAPLNNTYQAVQDLRELVKGTLGFELNVESTTPQFDELVLEHDSVAEAWVALLNGAENYSAKVTDARERLNAIHMPGGVDVESFDALFAEVEPWTDEVRGLEPHVEHIAAMLEAKEFEDALNQDPDEGP